MDFSDIEGSKEFQTLETICQSHRRHVPEDVNDQHPCNNFK